VKEDILRIISAKFGWDWLSSFRGEGLCKLEKRGDEIKKNLLLWNYWANLNQALLKWSLGGPLSKLCSNLSTFWLKIEQFWPFEEISIFSNGGHLGYRTALTDTILKEDHPRIISLTDYAN
jgi:hypothetical protein